MKYAHTKTFETLPELQKFCGETLFFHPHKTMEVKYTYNNIGDGKRITFKLEYTLVKIKKEVTSDKNIQKKV